MENELVNHRIKLIKQIASFFDEHKEVAKKELEKRIIGNDVITADGKETLLQFRNKHKRAYEKRLLYGTAHKLYILIDEFENILILPQTILSPKSTRGLDYYDNMEDPNGKYQLYNRIWKKEE